MFLSQLLEEYKEADEEDKDDVFKRFTERLWKSKYSFKKYKKYYKFRVNEGLLDNRIELIELFNKYNEIEYTICKSFYNKKIDFIDYIRVHINNTYGYLVDKDVYYKSEYYKLLITPKKEYFKVIKAIKNDEEVNCEETRIIIESALAEADIVRMKSINKKIELPFPAYKKLLNGYLRRIFDNYTPIHEYEEKYGWEMRVNVDGWSEDSYVVRYFNKSLSGYMRTYTNKDRGINRYKEYKECGICGKLYETSGKNNKHCVSCREKKKKENKLRHWHNNKHKYRC